MKKFLILLLCVFATDSFANGIGAVSSAPCDNDTLAKYNGTANIEINWEPNTIQLGWYDGDQQIAGPTSCVYDGTITVPPQPIKLGYTFNGWKVMGLPNGYTRLDYLESTGTQCIDTGVRLTSDNVIYEWEAKDNGASGDTSLFGSEHNLSATGQDNRLFSGILHGRNAYRCAYIGSTQCRTMGYNSSDNLFHSWILNIDSNHTASLTKDNIQVGNISWSSELNKNDTIALYCNHGGSNWLGQKASVAFRYFKITDNGNLVFNGIPARRNSDNTLGIYDTVSNTFKTNVGTGAFVAGPDM